MRKTADAIVLLKSDDQFKILLIRRKNPPFKGEYAFPGGFVEDNEDPLDGCIRELFEETDLLLDKKLATSLDIRKKKGRDPRGDTHTYPYLFLINDEKKIKAKDDALSVSWIKLSDISKLSFDHGAILCEALGKFNTVMPGSIENRLDKPKEVVFFGGSFNPWHAGHEECVRLFVERYQDKKLIVVPDFSPWKEGNQLSEHFCYFKAFQEIKEKLKKYPVEIYSGFFGRENPNPTADWFLKVKVDRKGLLMGDDQFALIKKWKEASTLIKNMDFLFVVPRILKDNEREIIKDELHLINDRLIIDYLSDHDYKHLSSTKLRGDHEKR